MLLAFVRFCSYILKPTILQFFFQPEAQLSSKIPQFHPFKNKRKTKLVMLHVEFSAFYHFCNILFWFFYLQLSEIIQGKKSGPNKVHFERRISYVLKFPFRHSKMPYLNEQGVPEYMQDALNQILQIRIRRQMPVTKYPTSPKEPINIAQFLGNYCKSVANGTHLFKSKDPDRDKKVIFISRGVWIYLSNEQKSPPIPSPSRKVVCSRAWRWNARNRRFSQLIG